VIVIFEVVVADLVLEGGGPDFEFGDVVDDAGVVLEIGGVVHEFAAPLVFEFEGIVFVGALGGHDAVSGVFVGRGTSAGRDIAENVEEAIRVDGENFFGVLRRAVAEEKGPVVEIFAVEERLVAVGGRGLSKERAGGGEQSEDADFHFRLRLSDRNVGSF
jgi:hypothetical protein